MKRTSLHMQGRPLQGRQAGLSLVELMIAIVLALILAAAVVQIFLSSNQTYRNSDAASRLQENARFGIDIISNDIRMAGFVGCVTPTKGGINNIVDPQADGEFDPDLAVEGWNNVGAGTAISGLGVIPGTDVLFLRGGFGAIGRLSEQKALTAQAKVDANVGGWQAEDILIVSDCETVDIFRATAVSSNPSGEVNIAHGANGNINPPGGPRLSKVYTEGADIVAFTSRTYFISTPAGAEVPSLYRWVGGAAPEVIVEGVEDLQILYGVDLNNNRRADVYRDASQVAGNWGSVVSAQLHLLLVSVELNVAPGDQTVSFNGSSVTFEDRRLRQPVTAAVTLRNRIP